MLSFLRGGAPREPAALPLFPLKTVLFPGGVLPLKVFEQRYIAMTKACLKGRDACGVCLLTRGERGRDRAKPATEFAPIRHASRGSSNRDMPQLGMCI
jgi:Lon protease-like protein